MDNLLVVVPYKLWFFNAVATLQVRALYTRLANSCSRKYILGIVVIKFNHIGCGVGGVLINDG